MKPEFVRARGLALVNAIFLLVVLGLLGAFMASVFNVEQVTISKSVLSARAYYGAKAGLEWGIQQSVAAGACAGSTALNLTGTGLSGVTVTVTCSSSTYGAGNVVYFITSVATAGPLGQPGYAERHMEATVSNIP